MPAGRPVVGIDLSATNLQFGVVDAGNAIAGRARGKTEAHRGLDAVVENVVRGVHEACAAAGARLADVGAVGVVAAGAIDIPRGVILNAPNLRWTGVPLRDLLREKLGRPVVLDNDVNGAVWGEYVLGAGRGRGDVLGIWIGTGIGGGLVLNGRLYYGRFFTAGEVGHTVADPAAAPGARALEEIASRTGMLREARERASRHPRSPLAALPEAEVTTRGTRVLADAWRGGDELARLVVERSADLVGIAIANLVTVLALGNVILGGGVSEALGQPYLDLVRRSFERDVFPNECRACGIVLTRLAGDAGLLGAALLARDALGSRTHPA
jgi:glucokinase